MNTKIVFSWLVLLLVLAGCAGSPDIADSLVASKYANVSSKDALKAAQIKFEDVKSAGLAFYAPNSFKGAKKALKKAEELDGEGKKEKSQLKYIYVTEQYIDKGERVRKVVENRLEAVLTLKKSLQQKDAKESYKSEFNDAMQEIRGLIEELETMTLSKDKKSNESKSFDKSQDALIKKLKTLEINVVKYNSLNESQKILSKAEGSNAEKVAPKTHKEAKAKLKEANEYIAKNVHDVEGVQEVGDKFRFAVQHLLHVTSAVNELAELKKKHYEDRILENEQRLFKISEAIKHEDVRDKSVKEQANILAKAVAGVNASNEGKSQDIAEMRDIETALLAEIKVAQNNTNTQSESLNQQVAALKMKLQISEKSQLPLQKNIDDLEKQLVELTVEKNNLAPQFAKSEKGQTNNGEKNQEADSVKAETAVVEAEEAVKDERILVGESTVAEEIASKKIDIIKVMNKVEEVTPEVTEVVVSEPKK
jgi:hypothetical protein